MRRTTVRESPLPDCERIDSCDGDDPLVRPKEKIESTEQKLPVETSGGVFEQPITAASIAVYRVVSLPSDGTGARCPRSGASCTFPFPLRGKNQRHSREHREDVPVGQIVEE
jgi:hypothetical protein